MTLKIKCLRNKNHNFIEPYHIPYYYFYTKLYKLTYSEPYNDSLFVLCG